MWYLDIVTLYMCTCVQLMIMAPLYSSIIFINSNLSSMRRFGVCNCGMCEGYKAYHTEWSNIICRLESSVVTPTSTPSNHLTAYKCLFSSFQIINWCFAYFQVSGIMTLIHRIKMSFKCLFPSRKKKRAKTAVACYFSYGKNIPVTLERFKSPFLTAGYYQQY